MTEVKHSSQDPGRDFQTKIGCSQSLSFLGADQEERGLWGRDCLFNTMQYLSAFPVIKKAI